MAGISFHVHLPAYRQPMTRARVRMAWYWLLHCRCITRTYCHITLTSTTQLWRKLTTAKFMEDVDRRRQFLLYQVLSVDAVLKNSTLGKFAYMWQIERDFIVVIKDWKNANSFFQWYFHCSRLLDRLSTLVAEIYEPGCNWRWCSQISNRHLLFPG